MSAILYLFRRKMANWFRQLRHNKSKLLMVIFWTIFIAATFASTLLGGSIETEEVPGEISPAEVTSWIMVVIWAALIIFLVVQALYQGTKRGSSVFTSPDIHFVFTGPLKGQTVLTYGILNSMTSVLISTFFMIYQLPNMRNMGLTIGDFIFFIFVWFVTITVAQLATMTLYLLLFDHSHLSALVRGIILVLPLIILLIYGFMVLNGGPQYERQPIEAMFGLLQSGWLLLIPILGWCLALMTAALSEFNVWTLVAGGLLLASTVLMLVYISRSEADFYEDAMGLTYEREAQLNKQKSGQVRKIKHIRKTGINKGWGADAVFYRQLREYRRTSPFLFTPAMLFYLMGGAMIAGFLRLMSNDGSFSPDDFSTYGLLVIFCGMILVMFWHGMFSSLIAEMESVLFYTAPASSFSKLLQASRLGILKIIIDILPSLIISLILMGLNPLHLILIVLALVSVHLVISGSQLLVYRFVGQIKGTVETMLLILIQAVAIAPTIGLIVLNFILLGFGMIAFIWPILLLISMINIGIFFCTLPAGVNSLEKGLER